MEAVAEQQMVKAILPFVVAGIMAVVGWLFNTVMELEKTALKNEQAINNKRTIKQRIPANLC